MMNKFTIPYTDSEEYSNEEISRILKIADTKGFPLHAGSYVENMTIKQLDKATREEFDA